MKTLRTGVVGVGHMGINHARVYTEIPGSQLSAVFDSNSEAAAAAAKRFGCRAASSLEEFASLVDAATICTPTVTHHPIGMELLEKGLHILIEKPISATPAEARELSARAAAKGCVLQVGHIERFNPVLHALESQLNNPRFLEVTRLSPFPNRSTDIGVGHMGINHARIYSEIPASELSAVFDSNSEAAAAAAKRFGCRAASSLEEFASLVDAATICTPTVTHHPIGMELLEKGLHILTEKPISATPAEARELSARAAAKGCVLQVGHIERFNPVLHALESQLNNPRFLEVTRLSPFPNRSTDIGVVLDLMIHDIEIILHLVRSPVESLDAVGIPVLSRGEDIANVRFRFANGCVANVTASRISQDRVRKIRVFQENAYLSLDYKNQSGYLLRLAKEGEKESSGLGKLIGLATDSKIVTDFSGHRIVREPVEVEKGEPLRIELESFLQCAREGLKPRVTGLAAADALDLALEITRRIEESDPRR